MQSCSTQIYLFFFFHNTPTRKHTWIQCSSVMGIFEQCRLKPLTQCVSLCGSEPSHSNLLSIEVGEVCNKETHYCFSPVRHRQSDNKKKKLLSLFIFTETSVIIEIYQKKTLFIFHSYIVIFLRPSLYGIVNEHDMKRRRKN